MALLTALDYHQTNPPRPHLRRRLQDPLQHHDRPESRLCQRRTGAAMMVEARHQSRVACVGWVELGREDRETQVFDVLGP